MVYNGSVSRIWSLRTLFREIPLFVCGLRFCLQAIGWSTGWVRGSGIGLRFHRAG